MTRLDIFRLAFLVPTALLRFLPPPWNRVVLAACAAGCILWLILGESRNRETRNAGRELSLVLGLILVTGFIFPFRIFFFNAAVLLLLPFYFRFLEKGSPLFEPTDRRWTSVLKAWAVRRIPLILGLILVAAAMILLSGHIRLRPRTFLYPALAVLIYAGLAEVFERWGRRYGFWAWGLVGPALLGYLYFVFEPKFHLFSSNLLPGIVIVVCVTFLFYLLDMLDARVALKSALLQYGILLAAGAKAYTLMVIAFIFLQAVNRARCELESIPGKPYKDFFSRMNLAAFLMTFVLAGLYLFGSRRWGGLYLAALVSALGAAFWSSLFPFLAAHPPKLALKIPAMVRTVLMSETGLLVFLAVVKFGARIPWETALTGLVCVNAVWLLSLAWDKWGKLALVAPKEKLLLLETASALASILIFPYLSG